MQKIIYVKIYTVINVFKYFLYYNSIPRIPVGARFSAPVQTGPEAHPAFCTMGTGSFQGVSCGRGVTPHPI